MSEKNKMNKKGELTTTQLVTIIILIVSFAVILILLWKLNLGKETDADVCRDSVFKKGSNIAGFTETSLKCYTKYVCITADGSCEELNKPEVYEVRDVNGVYNALANEMANCWWMFGEGKVNYVNKETFTDLKCSICSQVYFDDSLQEEIPELESGKLDEDALYDSYLPNNGPKEGVTYLEYFFGSNDIKSLRERLTQEKSAFGSLDLNKQHYIMMAIVPTRNYWVTYGGGLATIIAGIFGAPVYAVVGLGGLTVAIFVGSVSYNYQKVIAMAVEGESGNGFMSPSIIEINSEEFKGLKCGEILTYS